MPKWLKKMRLVFRKTMEDALNEESFKQAGEKTQLCLNFNKDKIRIRQEERLKREEILQRTDDIMDRLSHITSRLNQVNQKYVVSVEIDHRILSFGVPAQEELEIVADMLARRIRNYVLSTKFIKEN